MAKGRNKGMKFERDTCRQLSLWWSYQKKDDVFWRSAGSGGRATHRSKRGKTTSNSAGDISAIHNKGMALLKRITFELKRGYNTASIMNLIDTPPSTKKNEMLEFIEQAYCSSLQARSPYWAVIHGRDRKKTVIYLPWQFVLDYNEIAETSIHKRVKTFSIVKAASLRRYSGKVCCFVLEELLSLLDPYEIRRM